MMSETLGISHFLLQSDWTSRAVLVVLVGMSIASWNLIIFKAYAWYRYKQSISELQSQYQNIESVENLRNHLTSNAFSDSFSRVARSALDCCARIRQKRAGIGFELAQAENLVATALRQKVAEEMAKRDKGITILGSIASCSPFVGLFGTVWGIYHALLSVSLSGQSTLDKLAGPVGESLVMTACGLAVAIPAVLAYNTFVQANRYMQDELEAWSSEILILLATDCNTTEASADLSFSERYEQRAA